MGSEMKPLKEPHKIWKSVDALNTLPINRIVTMELLYRSHMQKIAENQKEQC